MSITIQDEHGADVEVFVRLRGGLVEAIVRAADRATFDAAALWRGITYNVVETTYDPETGESVDVVTDEVELSEGITLDHIGPVVITPGTYDADGVEITPPVIDNRHHVNMQIAPPALDKLDDAIPTLKRWQVTAIMWSRNGADAVDVNASERAKVLSEVELIDPDSIGSPLRVFS